MLASVVGMGLGSRTYSMSLYVGLYTMKVTMSAIVGGKPIFSCQLPLLPLVQYMRNVACTQAQCMQMQV